jgi:hypothetical protein
LTVGFALLAIPIVAAGACSSPSAPAPPTPPPSVQPPPPPAPVVNAAPVLSAIKASVTRAEVNQAVELKAEVTDAETDVDKLKYEWTSDAGEFTGTGRVVTWKLAPGKTATPIDLKVTLTVTETYDSFDNAGQPIKAENKVARTETLTRVHDSVAELSAMSMRFLVDLFGNSSVKADQCLVDFSDACPGKRDELHDIENNRTEFLILSATARVTSVTFDGARNNASIDLSCEFRDRHLKDGKEGTSRGTCRLTAVYERNRWWLCSSHFEGSCGSCAVPYANRPMTMREFFMMGIGKQN